MKHCKECGCKLEKKPEDTKSDDRASALKSLIVMLNTKHEPEDEGK